MGTELLEIEPRELKFTFELKKQSTCSVQLVNNSDLFVAFKVKTTSPKRYCVRPNVGVVQPRSSCDFTVTMQAQRVAPSDLQCRDKFLIQSTIVPFGTTEEDISPSMFAKDNGKYIEENKLRVVLVSPPLSPVLLPMNGALKQKPAYEVHLLPMNGALMEESVYESPVLKEQVLSSVENLLPQKQVADNLEEFKPDNDVQELKPTKDVQELKPIKDRQELRPAMDMLELKPAKDVLELELSPAKDLLELKLGKDEELKLAKDVGELTLAEDLGELAPSKDVGELRIVKDVGDLKLAKDVEDLKLANNVEDLKPAKDINELRVSKDVGEVKLAKDVGEVKLAKDVELRLVKDEEDLEPAKDINEFRLAKDVELRLAKDVELQLSKDIEKLKLKLNDLELKQTEAEITIRRLEKERNTSFEDRQALKQEFAMLKSKTVAQEVEVGFPFLFVCMVALVTMFLGYKLHS